MVHEYGQPTNNYNNTKLDSYTHAAEEQWKDQLDGLHKKQAYLISFYQPGNYVSLSADYPDQSRLSSVPPKLPPALIASADLSCPFKPKTWDWRWNE